MEDALTMARMAAESGVTHLVATPHCNLPYTEEKNYLSPSLLSRFVELRNRIQQAGIPLKLYPGSEILCTPNLPELIRQDKLIPLGNSNYLLIEFFFDEALSYMDDMLEASAAEGMRPVIAHPERYEAVQRNPHIIEQWFVRGHIIQLNKGSILGRLGRRAKHTAQWILSHGLAHVVASDAHSPVARTPQMSELIQYITDHCTDEYANILLHENPSRILNGHPVVQAD
jgi:protein-tyrosine phosphatase